MSERKENAAIRFNRRELAGSLGDLGTLLPIAVALILMNGLNPVSVMVCIGLYYVFSGLYFRITVPVQPMKVIGAYAIAQTMTPLEISTAGLWMGVFLLVLAGTGAMTFVGRIVPRPTIRGVQLTVGVLLLSKGVSFMLGDTSLQQSQGLAEPFLSVVSFGPIPVGIVLGVASVLVILFMTDSRRAPAALVVICLGVIAGLALGAHQSFTDFGLGLHLPELIPYGWPEASTVAVALTALALPQIPMTVGNAVIAQADLTREYFGPEESKRSTPRALAASMGVANVLGAFVGAMPMCHGAGGLAAHYRFGARTLGSNLMIGAIFLAIGLFVGDQAVALLSLIPFSVLGALLVFAGAQLALTVLDVKERNDLFVVLVMLGVSLATNLAIGFGVSFVLALLLERAKIKI